MTPRSQVNRDDMAVTVDWSGMARQLYFQVIHFGVGPRLMAAAVVFGGGLPAPKNRTSDLARDDIASTPSA